MMKMAGKTYSNNLLVNTGLLHFALRELCDMISFSFREWAVTLLEYISEVDQS